MFPLKIILLFLYIAILFCLPACDRLQATSLEKYIEGIPAKHLESYSFNPSSTLIDRVTIAPDFVLKYLKDMDKNESYSSHVPTKAEKEDLSRYINLLPKRYLKTLQERLIGIYFIDNFIGSGFADYVLGDNKQLFTIMIINPETMRHNISEWITYRENTAFLTDSHDDNQTKILVDCGTEYTGLMPLLLHETSHIMDITHHYTPYVEDSERQLGFFIKEANFTKDVWVGYETPVAAFDFSLRPHLSFYGLGKKELIPLSQAPVLYDGLAKSPFVSLYGSRNWADDFAEVCTWYYLTTKLHQPYRIIISRNGASELIYEPMKSALVRKRTASLSSDLE